jgi:spermidine synthase
VGRVYAANTIGSILGATLCSLVLVPALGTRDAQRVLIAFAAIGAMLLLVAPAMKARVALMVTPLLAALLIFTVPELPGVLVAHGRYAVTWLGKTEILYVGEGMNSSVAVTRVESSGATQFHVSGKVEASSLPQDMRLQKMLAHLPALVHPNPQTVLVVGFGAGVTAGSFRR